ncbi:MAG: ABC transporter permease [Clostridia bacterium]|nr:ABC transporter permease [Clostridia bacterium]
MLKIQKKQGISQTKESLLRVGSVIAALVAAGIVMALLGYNPFELYAKMIKGALGTRFNRISTIEKCIPLLVMSLGVSIAFKMKFWNIGAEGQFYMGAFGATWAWMLMPDLPIFLMLPVMALAAIIFGGLFALIPAILKHKLGTSETLVTLMLNYIAIRWITYLSLGPWKDPQARGQAKIYAFTENATLPEVFGIHIGWIVALVMVVAVYILMKYSKFGFEIAVLGENPDTARYAGMNVTKTLIIAVVLSGGICGLAGMLQATGSEGRLGDNISAGLGFTAIITAWLAKLSAPMILVSSFLFAVLLQGGSSLGALTNIPASVAETIQGIILFFVLASEFFTNYKIVIKRKETK